MYPFQSSTESARIIHERQLADHARHPIGLGDRPMRSAVRATRGAIGTALIRLGTLLADDSVGSPAIQRQEPT